MRIVPYAKPAFAASKCGSSTAGNTVLHLHNGNQRATPLRFPLSLSDDPSFELNQHWQVLDFGAFCCREARDRDAALEAGGWRPSSSAHRAAIRPIVGEAARTS